MNIGWFNSASFLLMLTFFFPALLSAAPDAEIAKYPNRPITFIVPLPAGSGPELASRLIAKEAEKILGQPIVIVNKPGASQTIGVAAIAAARPDWTRDSDYASRALVASSSSSKGAPFRIARAIAMRCRWPPDRRVPRSPRKVW